MTFSKLPKVIQDFGLGFQSINTAQANEQNLRDTYAVEHYLTVPSNGLNGLPGLFLHPEGGHNTVAIPRAVSTLKTQSVTLASGQTSLYFWFDVLSANGNYVTSAALQRYSAGFYFVVTKNCDDVTVWVDATPEGGASDTRFISTRHFSQLSGAPLTGAMIRCFERNSGTGKFEGADYNFSLALFSR